MPIYRYKCIKCSHEFEQLQTMKEDALEKCPKCLELSLEKCISLTTFRLLGQGWFRDGYKK